MNHHTLVNLCNHFGLGTPLNPPKRVHGGLLHSMWSVDTDKASYAIKQLSNDIDLANENILKNYNLTEEIASRFSEQGIPAVPAIKHAGHYLTRMDGAGFLVYPWVDARPLNQDALSAGHAVKIAEIIAKIHLIHLDVSELTAPVFDRHSNDNLVKLFNTAQDYDYPFALALMEHQNTLLEINMNYQNTVHLLKKQTMVSHGDLDPKNVLWDKNNRPVLIDWECAQKLNPTYEIVNAGLDWSGVSSHFNKDIFIRMMRTYSSCGGSLDKSLLPAAFNAVLGNWIHWMVYNIKRACTKQESEQKRVGIAQVEQTMKTIVNLKNNIPKLLDW